MKLKVAVKEHRYNSRADVVLRDVAIETRAGEIVTLVGPSGAGKSTLLNIIGGLVKPANGSVVFTDEHNQPVQPTTGYVFQSPRLMPWLSARDNISLVLTGEDANDTAGQLLERVGLAASADKFSGQLSGGMQRRVALARAFSVRPQLLLMDEPFVSLDLPTAEQLREQMFELWQADKPLVIFVTHDFNEALCVADRVIFFSANPGTPVLEIPVNLPRPRSLDDDNIRQLRRSLLAEYPNILRGVERAASNRDSQ